MPFSRQGAFFTQFHPLPLTLLLIGGRLYFTAKHSLKRTITNAFGNFTLNIF